MTQNHKASAWDSEHQKKASLLNLLALYSQEQNSVSEQMGRLLIEMMRATILEQNIDNNLWSEIIFPMT